MTTFDLGGTAGNDDLTTALPSGGFNARGRGGNDKFADNADANALYGDWNAGATLKAGGSRDLKDWFKSGAVATIFQSSSLLGVSAPSAELTSNGTNVLGTEDLFLVSATYSQFSGPSPTSSIAGRESLDGLGVRNSGKPAFSNGRNTRNQDITKGEVLGFELTEAARKAVIGLQLFFGDDDGDTAGDIDYLEVAIVTLKDSAGTKLLEFRIHANGTVDQTTGMVGTLSD